MGYNIERNKCNFLKINVNLTDYPMRTHANVKSEFNWIAGALERRHVITHYDRISYRMRISSAQI